MAEFEWNDRYTALGIPYPDPGTACSPCEGLGFLPNGVCPDCNGTGKRPTQKAGKGD